MAHRRLCLVAMVLAPALAGCGGGSGGISDAAKTPAAPTIQVPSPVPAATGVKVPGTGYAFHAPRHWRDVSKQVSTPGVDAAAAAATARAGFTSNINVIIANDTFTAAEVEQVTERARAKVDHNANAYRVEMPTRVAGALAGHLRGMHDSGEASYWLEQYLISHGRHTYVVSFSFSPKVPESTRDKQIASVLASWTWG